MPRELWKLRELESLVVEAQLHEAVGYWERFAEDEAAWSA
jgi:hypothetical protein